MGNMPSPAVKTFTSKRSTKDEKLTPEELIKFMKHHGISDKALSELFGVTGQAVHLWLTGQRSICVTNSRLIRLFMKHPTLIREF